jgi:hypothetical protein
MYKPITAENSQLYLKRYHSNLSERSSVGDSTISVYSDERFSANIILGIGEPGNEESEIILTHPSTSPSGNTITLATTLAKAHPKDTPVYILSFDQIQFFHADTIAGAKTQLGSNVTIDPGQESMIYEDTAHSSGYYFTRYYNSITLNTSDYSDPIPYSGKASNTFGYAVDTALEDTGASIGDILTYSMLISWANQMLRLVRGKRKVWSNYQKFDEDLGTMTMGLRRIAMPSDAYDQNTNKSILNLKIGNGLPMTYMDRSEYLQATDDVVYTEVATLAVVSGTSLVLDSTEDLPDTGSVSVYVLGTKYTVEYTANNRTTGTLTVATDQITYAFPVDSPVWYNVEEGDPEFYSIWDGYIYFWPMITSTYEGMRILADYYTDIEAVDSDADVIVGPRFDMLVHYLKWKIRGKINNNGLEDLTDPAYIQFSEVLRDATRLEDSGQINTFRPRDIAVSGGRGRRR